MHRHIGAAVALLLLSQLLSVARSTRLPLEVYELTPPAGLAESPSGGDAATVKHKSLEYTIYEPGAVTTTTTTTTTAKPDTKTAELKVVSMDAEEQQQQAPMDSRRARQMLQQHRFGGSYYALGSSSSNGDSNNNNKKHAHGKDVRILYQVGDSEDELPICAPNAVCSKIDLYETPWIERQCRCPESNRLPNNVILHHHAHTAPAAPAAADSQKYRSYYEKHKRLLLGEFNDKKFESLHLKKLMQKLGAVYEDDLHLQPADYMEPDYNDALPHAYDEYAADNELPAPRREFGSAAAHMRHSGHRGLKEPLTFIGGCPSSLGIEDGHTIADKTRHYKLCQPVHKLPVCKHFRDYTWTLTTAAELNVTEQIVHCRCPKNSVTYLTKREPSTNGSFKYLFACSPLTRLRCQRKQPCKLFTVRKRQEFLDEVNINSLCQCPKGHRCPSHHTQSGVIAGESFLEDNIQTYSGYCMAND